MSQLELDEVFDAFMQGIYGPQLDTDTAEKIVKPNNELDAAQCLGIYRGSVLGNLTQALGDIYPAIKRGVGEQFFDAIAGRYIRQFPSRSASLDEYGEHFSDFVADFPPLKDMPYMCDLAKVEWAWHRAFHAPDEAPLDAAKLQSLSEAEQLDLTFSLNESAYLLSSTYPIQQIWLMNRGFIEETQIELSEESEEFLVVWRQGYDTRVDVVSKWEYAFLLNIKNQQTLGTNYENLLSKGATNEQLVSALINTLSSGRLTGFTNP